MKIVLDGTAVSRAYAEALSHMSRLPGFDIKAILRAEAGSILKRWAGLLPIATEDKMLKRARIQALRNLGLSRMGDGNNITINAGIRNPGAIGKVWLKTRGPFPRKSGGSVTTGRPYIDIGTVSVDTGSVSIPGRDGPRHLKGEDWSAAIASMNAYRSEVARTIAAGRKSMGLAQQSVVQIADSLNIDLTLVKGRGISASAVNRARAAIASNGRAFKNGFGTEGGDAKKSFVQLINRLPYGEHPSIGMSTKLAIALQGRTKYLNTAMAKGVYNSLEQTRNAFPEILRVAPQVFEQESDE